jgi:hypothetical protein
MGVAVLLTLTGIKLSKDRINSLCSYNGMMIIGLMTNGISTHIQVAKFPINKIYLENNHSSDNSPHLKLGLPIFKVIKPVKCMRLPSE